MNQVSPRVGQLRVTVAATAEALLLQVADSGPGIPAGERQRVLERFHRLHAGEVPGSGLGLAIVARIAALHGADLELDASPLGGLEVRVRWPR